VNPGSPVTYSVNVWNDAEDTPLTAVSVTVDGCATVDGPTGDDGNGLLEMGETWSYACSKTLTATTDTAVCALAQFIAGGTDSACATVTVATVAAPTPSPTPAQPAPASPAPTPTPAPPAAFAPAPSTAPSPSEQPELVSPTPSPLPPDIVVVPPPAAPPAPPSDGGTAPKPPVIRHEVRGGDVLAIALDQVSTVVKPEAAVAVASAFSFPLALMAAVVAFLVGQGRVDARDPKLRSAPRTPQEMVLSFRNEEEL
jgi:hypothetical protein